jgi:hypothetical protein
MSESATRSVIFDTTTKSPPSLHISLGLRRKGLLGDTTPRMLLSLTTLEKRIIAVLALMIVLGLIGMSVL